MPFQFSRVCVFFFPPAATGSIEISFMSFHSGFYSLQPKGNIMPFQFSCVYVFFFPPAATGSIEIPFASFHSRFYSLHRLEHSSAKAAVLSSSYPRATSTREHAPRALALQIARGIQDPSPLK